MKHVIFVWIPLVLLFLFLLAPLFVIYPIPFAGAIMLAGSSITLYATGKSFGVYQSAKVMPTGEGVSPETKKKLLQILIAIYVIIIEALIIQYIKPEATLPLDDLFTMAAVAAGVCLGGAQAMKAGEQRTG